MGGASGRDQHVNQYTAQRRRPQHRGQDPTHRASEHNKMADSGQTHSLCLSSDIHWFPWFLGSETCTRSLHHQPPTPAPNPALPPLTPTGFQAFRIGLNYTNSFPGSLVCRRQIVGRTGLHSLTRQFLYCVFSSVHPVDLLPLENPDWQSRGGTDPGSNPSPDNVWPCNYERWSHLAALVPSSVQGGS